MTLIVSVREQNLLNYRAKEGCYASYQDAQKKSVTLVHIS